MVILTLIQCGEFMQRYTCTHIHMYVFLIWKVLVLDFSLGGAKCCCYQRAGSLLCLHMICLLHWPSIPTSLSYHFPYPNLFPYSFPFPLPILSLFLTLSLIFALIISLSVSLSLSLFPFLLPGEQLHLDVWGCCQEEHHPAVMPWLPLGLISCSASLGSFLDFPHSLATSAGYRVL